MSLRNMINGNPALVGGVVVVIAAVALFLSYRHSFAGKSTVSARYFTTDDGQTYFSGTQDDFAPFMKDGKEAVRAYVFECDGKPFVGYLERYDEKSRQVMIESAEAAKAKRPPKNIGAIIAAQQGGTQLKRPGDAEWISGAPGQKSAEIRTVKCKDGTMAEPKNLK